MIYHPNLYLVDFLLSIFTIGILVVVGYFVFKAMQKADVIPALNTEERKARKQAKAVSKSVDDLSSVLFGLKKVKGKKANIAIEDAKVIASHVVKSAIAFAKRHDEYQKRSKILGKALKALDGNNHRKLAVIAGEISSFDEEISRLLLSSVPASHDKFWQEVISMVSSQRGVYKRWGDVYQNYSADLVNKVTAEKAKIAKLSASSEFIEMSKPMLHIIQKLEDARSMLRLSSPKVRRVLATVMPESEF